MNCKLVGNIVQHLEVILSPGEDFYAEKGALIYLESGIEKELSFNGTGLGQVYPSSGTFYQPANQ